MWREIVLNNYPVSTSFIFFKNNNTIRRWVLENTCKRWFKRSIFERNIYLFIKELSLWCSISLPCVLQAK